MSGVLVYSERDNLARELLVFAAAHADALGPCSAAVLGEQAGARAEAHAGWGADKVFAGELPELSDEVIAAVLARLVEQLTAEAVLLGATRRGRSLAPRLAQLLGAGCVSEAVQIGVQGGELVTSRYTLGGNTLARERILTARKVIAVVPGGAAGGRAGAGEAGGAAASASSGGRGGGQSTAAGAEASGRSPTGEIAPLPFEPPAARARVVRRDPKPPAGADIAGSERLVCIGRGLASADDLPLVRALAEALGAEVACTRPLSYEYGWLPEERMIGISGVRANPRLMLSLGVSGQVQHAVGITGAKLIVAINQDPSAPIFKLADYGIVGDLYQVAPILAERLRQRSSA